MKLIKQIFGISLGLGLAFFLLSRIDFSEVLKYKDRIQPIYLIYTIILGPVHLYLNSWSDYYIYEKKIKIKNLLIITLLSEAAVLFARRLDDVIKTYSISKESKESYLSAFFRINVIKFLNLFLALIGGIMAFFFVDIKFDINEKIIYFCIFCIFTLCFCLFYKNFFYKYFIYLLSKVFSFLKKENLFHVKIKPYFDYAINHFTFKYLFYPVVISTFIHFVLRYFSGYYTGKMLGIEFSYWEILFIGLLTSVTGLIPFIPLNGVGIYHATIVSSFIIIGKPEVDGIIYGVVTHALGLIFTILYGLIAYFVWGRKIIIASK